MIAKKLRIPDNLFSKKPAGQIHSDYFQLKTFPNDCGHNRFGAVVGLKVDKLSVKRHFWKRFILNRAALQPDLENDFIIFAKPALGKISKKEAEGELKKIFSEFRNKNKNEK